MIVDLNKDYIFRGFVFEIFAEKKLRKIKKNTFIFRTLQFKDLDTILNYYNLNINDIKGKYLLKKYFRCIDLIEFEIPIIKKDEPKIVKNINVYEVKTKIHTRKRGNDIFRQRRREGFIDKNFLKEFNKKDKFVLFLLAVDSESSTLLDTAFYINQIEVAKNIVKSLPIEYKLLVKEHPAAGLRSWRKIVSTPNVVPIHHYANTEELIKKSSLVISLSGSTSLDALFFEKPSIVFADTDYSMIPEVRKIDKIENLSNTINDALKTRVDPKNIEKYIQFIEKNSFDYNFILHVMEAQKYVYHGSLLVDVEFSEEEMNEFLNKTKSRFAKLTRAYVEKINEYI